MFKFGFGGTAASYVMALALVIGFVMTAPLEAQACGAKGFVREVSGKMLGAAKAGSVDKFRSLIKTYADVGAIGKFALGKHRKLVPASRRKAYEKGMLEFMAKTLAEYGKKFRAIEVEVGRCAGEKVNARLIRSSGRAQPVIYKVKKKGSKYKVVDLQVQNVWLGPLMRTTFNDVIKKGGGNIAALYKYLGMS
ncbi:MAG: ABC transporter substrate-binding protein [Pseudomonadota bacterium]